MRDGFVYHFISGHAFWTGLALLAVAWLISQRTRTTLVSRLRSWSLVLGVTAIVLSATPIPAWIALPSGLSLLVWLWLDRATLAAASIPSPKLMMIRKLVALSWLACAVSELPHQFAPQIPRDAEHWAVIGDSLSAEFGEGPPWPTHVADASGLKIQNVAVAGATAKSALQQADQLHAAALVLVEIGGNDLLGETSVTQFEQDLDRLLGRLVAENRAVLMVELPLPPWGYAFGVAQRRLASKYRVRLIPKRFLAGVLTTPGATTDGLHLSQQGHANLARRILSLREKN